MQMDGSLRSGGTGGTGSVSALGSPMTGRFDDKLAESMERSHVSSPPSIAQLSAQVLDTTADIGASAQGFTRSAFSSGNGGEMLQVGQLVRSVTDLELRLSKLEQDKLQNEEIGLLDSARRRLQPYEVAQTEPRPAATDEVSEAMQRLAEAKMFCEEAEEARLAAEEALHFERDWRRSEMQHAADLAVQVSELARQLALTRVNAGSIAQPSEERGLPRRGIEWPRDGMSATIRAVHQDERFHTEDAPSFVIPAFQSNRYLAPGSLENTHLPSPHHSPPPQQQSPPKWASGGPWQQQQPQQQQSQIFVRCGRGQQAELSRLATPARSRPYSQVQSKTGGASQAAIGAPTWSPKPQFRSAHLLNSSSRGSPVGIRQRSRSMEGEGSPQSPRPPAFPLAEQQQQLQQEQASRRKWRYSLPSAVAQQTLRANGSRGNLTKGQSVVVMPAHPSPKPPCRAGASVTVNPWVPPVPPVAAKAAASGSGCAGAWLTPRGPSLVHAVPGVRVSCSSPTLPVAAVAAPPVFQGVTASSAATLNSGIPAFVDRSVGMLSTVRAGSHGRVAALSPLAQRHKAMNSRSP